MLAELTEVFFFAFKQKHCEITFIYVQVDYYGEAEKSVLLEKSSQYLSQPIHAHKILSQH